MDIKGKNEKPLTPICIRDMTVTPSYISGKYKRFQNKIVFSRVLINNSYDNF